MKPSFDDLALFVQVARRRSLAAAAEYMQLPAATVTRRLKRLESALGYQLVRRSARHFSLTSEGEICYQRYAGLMDELELTRARLSRDNEEMSGLLRVSAPTNLATGLLRPMWTEFMRQHPGIRLELMLSNRTEDMLDKRIDIALRIGPQADSGLFQKKLGWVKTRLVASPEYLLREGMPERLEQLQQHQTLVFKQFSPWRLQERDNGRFTDVHLTPAAWADDLALVCQFACDGLGIALLPDNETRQPLASGKLQIILPQWSGPRRDIFAVWPDGKLLNARARCLRTFMQGYIGELDVLQGGDARTSG
ncbi:LysR family transcriptional regulator [Marinobacterium sediminicola]|uniref:LysR family transcriptional regulator, transcriptional activator AphB n=1 Tax=Marinobacterium sediminicola TaxID=518898 RepID=A0ABY1RYJ7_9GAMM|nr:LysR family transcriptional regulator [Marinobacterium sediminicola]ULG68100.1 LysR substrate-binding domain-containing protein [Marinobacterium sediminicola]SMR73388.1 LysR family transcriptional regulator, transcriptional activator AphB [Marinobacterium sediminicola]